MLDVDKELLRVWQLLFSSPLPSCLPISPSSPRSSLFLRLPLPLFPQLVTYIPDLANSKFHEGGNSRVRREADGVQICEDPHASPSKHGSTNLSPSQSAILPLHHNSIPAKDKVIISARHPIIVCPVQVCFFGFSPFVI